MREKIEVYEVTGDQRPTDVSFSLNDAKIPMAGDLLIVPVKSLGQGGTGYIGGGGAYVAFRVLERAHFLTEDEGDHKQLSYWIFVKRVTEKEYWAGMSRIRT